MPATKPLPKITTKEQEALYERYIAPVVALAERFSTEEHYHDSPKLRALEDYSPNIHILSDVIAWAYIGTLKSLPHNSVMTMLRLLDEGAKRQYASTGQVAKKQADYAHERLFGAALVEVVLMEMYEDSSFSGDFLLYYMMAVMQLAIVMHDIERMTDAERVHHFVSMRVCLERATFSCILMLQSRMTSPQQLARKGGKQKFIALYGPAYEYTKRRCEEIRAEKLRISKLQIAKIISREAETLVEFRVMSKENRERTIYDWVRKL
jgi:hypothetical protein